MRLKNLFSLLTLCFMLFMSTNSNAAIETQNSIVSNQKVVLKHQNITKESFEQTIGRKLTWKERLVFPLIKRKLEKSNAHASNFDSDRRTDGMAIAGFVCGLVGIFVAGIILGTLGIVFSAIALGRINKDPDGKSGRGLAIAGLILGIIAVVGAAIVISNMK
jgi:Domain of unknown function (DUF4190)